MTLLGWVLGLALPACGADGAAGLPVPVPLDMAKLERPATPNTFLAAPADTRPEPDEIVAEQPVPASNLYARSRALFSTQPRTYIAAEFADRLQIHYVVRSALLNFPDLVVVQVSATATDRSVLAIWSRSVYGRSDFGVNRQRTKAWLAALQLSNQR